MFRQSKKLIKMSEVLITAIFAACLLGGVYIYAYWATTSGSLEDENQNFIPDSWEKNFKWLFTGKTVIMLILGLIIGYLIGSSTLLPYRHKNYLSMFS